MVVKSKSTHYCHAFTYFTYFTLHDSPTAVCSSYSKMWTGVLEREKNINLFLHAVFFFASVSHCSGHFNGAQGFHDTIGVILEVSGYRDPQASQQLADLLLCCLPVLDYTHIDAHLPASPHLGCAPPINHAFV